MSGPMFLLGVTVSGIRPFLGLWEVCGLMCVGGVGGRYPASRYLGGRYPGG